MDACLGIVVPSVLHTPHTVSDVLDVLHVLQMYCVLELDRRSAALLQSLES